MKKFSDIVMYVQGAVFFISVFVMGYFLFSMSDGAKEFSILMASWGFYLLLGMVLLKSIYFILKKASVRWYRVFGFAVESQRELGMIAFNLIFVHVFVQIITFFGSMNFKDVAYGSGLVAFLILIFMQLTSFVAFRSWVKNWKKLHSLVWFCLVVVFGHIYIVSDNLFNYFFFLLLGYCVIICECFYVKRRGIFHLKLYSCGVLFWCIYVYFMNMV